MGALLEKAKKKLLVTKSTIEVLIKISKNPVHPTLPPFENKSNKSNKK